MLFHIRPFTVSADLIGCRLMSTGVFVSERPIEGGDVDAAASLAHQIEPGLEDGGVSGAGIKLQPFRDALHQNDPDRGKRGNGFMIKINMCSPGSAYGGELNW